MYQHWSKLFGEKVLKRNEDGTAAFVDTFQTLNKKYVGMYFGAKWCPPSVGFTSKLCQFYEIHHNTKDFEIVYISKDKDKESFNQYCSEMTYCAIGYQEEELRIHLYSKYEIETIPALLWFDPNGRLTTKAGKTRISNDPDAFNFPWHPPPLIEAFKGNFVRGNGTIVDDQNVLNKVILLFHSASWSDACNSFTLKLIEYYENLNKKYNFEVVLVASENSEDNHNKYVMKLPWLSYMFNDSRLQILQNHMEVKSIPYLAVIDTSIGTIIARNIVQNIDHDPLGLNFPYVPEPVSDLAITCEGYYGNINNTASIILLMQSSNEKDKATAKELLINVAKEMQDTIEKHKINLCTSSVPNQTEKIIRLKTSVPEMEYPILLYLHLQSCNFQIVVGELSTNTIIEFIKSCLKNKSYHKKIK